ncbi:hypothetical protein PoB_001482600 [Plakobranchus ocellatus]|uniref:Uncharacterized protein n=1 Tax=Plakobranchus ocellatus TaxID=259542 RepID=A0AAV3YXU6_9GAST|nr:hypothetical protein PoB_001482600 [Plakobranchus ocellatus]
MFTDVDSAGSESGIPAGTQVFREVNIQGLHGAMGANAMTGLRQFKYRVVRSCHGALQWHKVSAEVPWMKEKS